METIGDAYMVVSGLPIRNEEQHASEIALMALHINSSIKRFKIHHRPNESLNLRIGINSGKKKEVFLKVSFLHVLFGWHLLLFTLF